MITPTATAAWMIWKEDEMSKEKYETCEHIKSIGQIAVYVTPSCPQATQIKGHLVSSKERCRRCRVFTDKEEK